tara:strand:+ start:241 stop:471 length:231 start_codon:yes stop_codon:yes gene_type:complete
MTQTETWEIISQKACKIAITLNVLHIHSHFSWTKIFSIIALTLGWLNSLGIQAINETLGTNVTNAAIFGNNTCTYQ